MDNSAPDLHVRQKVEVRACAPQLDYRFWSHHPRRRLCEQLWRTGRDAHYPRFIPGMPRPRPCALRRQLVQAGRTCGPNGFLIRVYGSGGSFGGLLAYAIYHMGGAAGIAGCRWIYIIEGVITIVYGLVCFILVPSSYEKAFFLNEDDKEVMRYRATVTHQYSGGSGEFTFKDIWIAAEDIKTWIHSALQFCCITPLYGFNNFLPIIVKDDLGFGTLETQYLTIPVQLWGAIIYAVIVVLSDRYRKRYLFEIIFTPITALGYVILLSPVSAGVHYFATYLITTGCYIIAGNNLAWASANSAPDAKRAATLGIVLTWTDCSGVVSGQLYRSEWAPKYTVGNAWSLGVILTACLLFTWVTLIYRRRNAQKVERQGEVIPKEELTDRAPDFHYQW